MALRPLALSVFWLFAFAGCKSQDAPAAAGVDASAPRPPALADFASACVVHFTGRMKEKGPEYEVVNQSTKKPKTCTFMGYAYDARGTLLALSHSGGEHPTYGVTVSPAPAPGETEKQSFGMEFDDERTNAPGVSFEAILTQVQLPDGTFLGDPTTYPKDRPMTRRK